ncbi:methionine ABC transporter permease [Bifidobacterium aquikefiri]|uniref:methionine ABC transporter permease n=1 Tax=Bifidobacterium aquikefiri TaxID=1653207 RepID=UPI0039EC9069
MFDIVARWFPHVVEYRGEFISSIWETAVMVGVSGAISLVLSLILGVLLVTTPKGGLLAAPLCNRVLSYAINVLRSVPFIILAAALVPLTRALTGAALGLRGAVFPLVVGITPFFARQVEAALMTIPSNLIETAYSMGFTPWKIIRRVYLREGIPALAKGTTITMVSLIGLSAISGSLGSGGLGDFAIRYGYQRFMFDATLASVIVLLCMVGFVEFVGKIVVDATTRQ